MRSGLIRRALIGGLRAVAAGYVAGGAALSIGGLIEEQLTSFPNFSALLNSFGAFLIIIIFAPLGLLFLSFLLLPAFFVAFFIGFIFCYFDIRSRWLATVIGTVTGVVILPLSDALLSGELNLGDLSNWLDDADFVVILASAGAAGSWFAYPAWFPKQDITQAPEEA